MKYGQQRLAAGRKNFIFFLCPLDGEQFREISCFFFARMLGDSTLISLCKNANSIKTTPQLHLNSTFVVYHKGVPSRRDTTGNAVLRSRRKNQKGGTQVNPLVLHEGNEVAQT